MLDRLNDGEAPAPAVHGHGSGIPLELSSALRPEAVSILPQKPSTEAGSEPAEHPAEAFLRLIGKDPERTWFRTIAHGKGSNRRRSGRDLHGFDAAALEADNQEGELGVVVIDQLAQFTSVRAAEIFF